MLRGRRPAVYGRVRCDDRSCGHSSSCSALCVADREPRRVQQRLGHRPRRPHLDFRTDARPFAAEPPTRARPRSTGPSCTTRSCRRPITRVKDAALVAVERHVVHGRSARSTRDGTWRIGIEHSTDLRTWSPMTFMPHDPASKAKRHPTWCVRPTARSSSRTSRSCTTPRRAGEALLPHDLRLRALLAAAAASAARYFDAPERPPDRRRARVDPGRLAARVSRPARIDPGIRDRPLDIGLARRSVAARRKARHPGVRRHDRELPVHPDQRQLEAARHVEPARPSVPLRSRRQRQDAARMAALVDRPRTRRPAGIVEPRYRNHRLHLRARELRVSGRSPVTRRLLLPSSTKTLRR